MTNTPDDTLEAYIQSLLSEESLGELCLENTDEYKQIDSIKAVEKGTAAENEIQINEYKEAAHDPLESLLIEDEKNTERENDILQFSKVASISVAENRKSLRTSRDFTAKKESSLPEITREPAQIKAVDFGVNKKQETTHEPPVQKPELALKSQESLSLQEQVATLEEHKRQKLQEMLSQQALPKIKHAEIKTATRPKTETKTELHETKEKQELKQEQRVHVGASPRQKNETESKSATIAEQKVDLLIGTQKAERQGVYKLLEWGENGRPIWAQGDFDALFFEVSGLTLAVPLVALGQIVNLDKKPTPIAGQSEWFMGMFPTSLGDLRTVNTALFVMPERYNPDFVDLAKFIISIDGLPWGLAVDAVNQPVRLKPEDVNWRTQRGKRPWLAGTVKSKMCALIDIPQMAKLLDQSDKNRRS